MAEVADNLVPMDGLTNSSFHLDSVVIVEGGGANVKFELLNESGMFVTFYDIRVGPTQGGNTDTLIAAAHVLMIDSMRQWLYGLDKAREIYEKQGERS